MSDDSADLARFQKSALNSGQFSTRLVRRLGELADAAGGDLERLAGAFGDEFPEAANAIKFVLSVTTRGYDIIREIGRGGMAIVFEVANRNEGGRAEALKWLRVGADADNEDGAARFDRERQYLEEAKGFQVRVPKLNKVEDTPGRWLNAIDQVRQLNPRHMVKIYGAAATAEGIYFTMELLHGMSLRELVEQGGPVPLMTALDYTRQIANGLATLHANLNIIHRDVKPSNVFLEETAPPEELGPAARFVIRRQRVADGEADYSTGRVVLLDLGIAKRTARADTSEDNSFRTNIEAMGGRTFGTLAYSSPQQLTNSTPVDPSDDIYALGCVLYYLLTGEHAFGDAATGVAAAAVAHSRAQRPHLPERQCLRGVRHEDQRVIPRSVDDLLQRMIHTEPACRIPNGQALRQELERLLTRLENFPEIIVQFVKDEIASRFGKDDSALENNPFKLSNDQRPVYEAALAAYLKHLREVQISDSPVPLVRAGTHTKLKIKEVFVEIDLITEDTNRPNAESESRGHTAPASNPDKTKVARNKLVPPKQVPLTWASKVRPPKSATQKGEGAGDSGPSRGEGSSPTTQAPNRGGRPGVESGLGGLLYHNRMLVFRGPPGGGKTTLLKRATLAFAEARSQDLPGWLSGGMVPVFLRLRSYAAYLQSAPASPNWPRIVEYLGQYYKEQNLPLDFFHRFLETKGCAVFMDGLDEVPEALREVVAGHVAEFVERYDSGHGAGGGRAAADSIPKRADEDDELQPRVSFALSFATVDPARKRDNLFVVASRPKGYEAVKGLLPKPFKVCDVKSLELPSILQLLDNVLQVIEPNIQKRAHDLAGLFKAVKDSRELTVLAGTPLFCTALVLVYLYRAAELPKRRVDVFEEIVDLLLGFWKAEDWKPLPGGPPTDELESAVSGDLKAEVSTRKKRLSHIAGWMQRSKKRTEIPQETLVEVLAAYLRDKEPKLAEKAEAIAEQFLQVSHHRSGLLVEMEPKVFAFTHEGFREYLVAQSLTNMREPAFIKEVFKHIDDPTWEEVILLAGATAGLADGTREYLLSEFLKRGRKCRADGEVAKWAKRLVMAGKMAYDMGEYLSPRSRDKLKAVLGREAMDANNDLKHRNEVALALDDIGWLTDALYACVPVSAGGKRFYLGKNLVTTHQYQRFLVAKDANDRAWWEEPYCVNWRGEPYSDMRDESLHWYQSNPGDKRIPKSWGDPKFGISHRGKPVVGISWFEANAYCRWLKDHWDDSDEAKASGQLRPRVIRLPTEDEWCAGVFGCGPERRFPWLPGDLTDAASADDLARYANIGRILYHATPVGLFPLGVREPDGLTDACGNVWEWQANQYDQSYRAIALRGGAYSTALADAGCDLRGCREPAGRDTDLGFRILIEG